MAPLTGRDAVGCALIGCGYWGSRLREYLNESSAIDLRYVCNTASDLETVWRDEDVAAVVVATPNATHYDLVGKALRHGKHVLAEKPLALQTWQCEELRDLAADRGLALLVEYTYTFSKALATAQSLVRQGEIGGVSGMEMAVRHLGRFCGGSVYWLLGSHMLAVLGMFFPLGALSFRRTDIVGRGDGTETGSISFRNGEVCGRIDVSLNFPGKETRIIIYGEDGTILYDPVNQPSLQVEKYEKVPWTVASELPRHRRTYCIDESNNLRHAVDHFREVIAGRGGANVDLAVDITRVLQSLEGA